MRVDILTIFPKMFDSVFDLGVIGRAKKSGKLEIVIHNIRDHSLDAHKTVDDAPYGGGPGMVMKADVLAAALEAVPQVGNKRCVVLLSAGGKKLTHAMSSELADFSQLVLVCGRYEGVDERFILLFVDREISIGDYVLSGGEIPAMALCDSVARLIPGILGNAESLVSESHTSGLLEYPQYTRPADFRGLSVPEVLVSGDHKKIEKWRHEAAVKKTAKNR